MASVANDGKARRILFVVPDGKRKTLRVGRVDKKMAESIRVHVGALLAARISSLPVQPATGTWLNTIGEALQKKLAKVGLEPWPRLRRNLRANCESDLAQAFPLAVITKWLGNSPSIALRRYLDPADAAYAQALNWMPPHESGQMNMGSVQTNSGIESGARVARGGAPQAPASGGKIEKNTSEVFPASEVMQSYSGPNFFLQNDLVERRGFEPNSTSDATENTSDTSGHPGGTQSGTLGMQPRCDIPSKSTESAAPSGKNEHENGSSVQPETLNGPSDPLETPDDPSGQLETLKRLARCLSPEQRRQLAEWLIQGDG